MLYDTTDCVQRCRDHAQLPQNDESMDASAWQRLLTTAQRRWYGIIATIAPRVLSSDPELLASVDGGATYTFGLDEDGRPLIPLGQVELYRELADASRPEGPSVWAMRPGVHYRVDGDRVRFDPTHPIQFTDGGPYAVFVAPPAVIDETHQPSLLPIEARELMVLSAVETWAAQGDLRDPAPFSAQIDRLWTGGGQRGNTGLLGTLKGMHFGNAAPPRRGYGRGIGGYGTRRAY